MVTFDTDIYITHAHQSGFASSRSHTLHTYNRLVTDCNFPLTYLEHLMKNDICHPVIAMYINCQTMWHVKHVVSPSIFYISCFRIEHYDCLRSDWSLLDDIVVSSVGIPDSFASMEDYWISHRINGNRCDLSEFLFRLGPVLDQNWLRDARLLCVKVLKPRCQKVCFLI